MQYRYLFLKENMLKWRNGEWNNLLDVVREGGDVSTNEYQMAGCHPVWMVLPLIHSVIRLHWTERKVIFIRKNLMSFTYG